MRSSTKIIRMATLPSELAKSSPGLRNFITVHMQQYPFIFSDERKYRIRRHLALWAAWWVFQSILYAYTAGATLFPHYKRLPISMVDAMFFLAPHIFLSYSLMYFVIPKFIFKGKYVTAVVLVLYLFFVTAFISAMIGIHVLPSVRLYLFGRPGFYYPEDIAFFLSLLAGLRGGITVAGLAAAIKLMKYWYMKEQRNLQLQKENAESQLQLLKAQVHPHFLFNTLNNIYSYTQNTSPTATQLVGGLSDMLRFILYECNQPLVPLAKELKMIQDYINLESIRYGNKLDVHIDIPQKTSGVYIAPLLLLPLVENCFKHGTSNVLEQPWINLHITLEKNVMQMKLINGKTEGSEAQSTQAGIGIANVQKRLGLIYPKRHELSITNDPDVFVVNLKIVLEQKKDTVANALPESQQVYA
jgi:sensor histidine kinase YesM